MTAADLYVAATENAMIARATGVNIPNGVVDLAQADFKAYAEIMIDAMQHEAASSAQNSGGRALALVRLNRSVLDWRGSR